METRSTDSSAVHSPPAVRRLVAALGIYALVSGSVTLLGWRLHIPRLTDWDGNGIAMFVNTALAGVAAGIALLLLAVGRRWSLIAAGVLGIIAAGIGAATLFEHATGID